jgi:hypothetical protein
MQGLSFSGSMTSPITPGIDRGSNEPGEIVSDVCGMGVVGATVESTTVGEAGAEGCTAGFGGGGGGVGHEKPVPSGLIGTDARACCWVTTSAAILLNPSISAPQIKAPAANPPAV